ncbi:hypothetical protein HN51_027251 [Arachis hypogaea]|uniref:PB1 domain-containing protein n=1 Tax=Arachis hypogaea TaxID=3818 RepID=A0A445BNS7_ARAHY|nr:replication protein A 70 kDa DNA-binding subunit A-like [Arachis hypogaea]RYR40328.1 hypothetical protein Ahy_A09g046061 isoform B [Arachis hypogaea]
MDTTPARFMLSYGGEIKPRDGHHHRSSYAGGVHKMFHVDGNINFDDMTAKLSLLKGGDAVTSFKYLIPGDDLDTLVTVDNEMDLSNLMSEYDLHCHGSGWLAPMRIFLDTVEQGGVAVVPQAPVPPSASDEDRVNMELEGQLEQQWGRVSGRASFSLPGPLTLASALFLLVALILLVSLPMALLILQNYSIKNAMTEIRSTEPPRDRLIQFEKSINQLPEVLVPAKDTIEMVLHDKKGSRIHASLPKALVKKFCPVAKIIQNGNIDDKELIDIIVEVVGNKGRQIVFTFEDLDKNRVTCILFGTLVDHIFPHLDSIGPGPLIVERAKSFLDKVHVQSSYYASKLHVNVYIKEVVDSKNRLGSTCQITSQYISHLSSQPSYSESDEINGGLVRLKSIEELLNCANEGSYWILASIVRLDVEKDDWFYKGCTRCPRKLEGAEPSYCKKCDQADSNPLLRFRFQVIVSDGTGRIILLVLWDRETLQIVGKTATEIKENFFDDDDADTKLLIKVAVSSRNINGYDDVYNVMRISDDEQLIAKFGRNAADSVDDEFHTTSS